MIQGKTYQAAVLPQPNQNIVRALLSLEIEEKPLRQPQPDELLLKMEAAPFNPSDIAFMQDGYQVKKRMPCVPGFEGAGIVVAVGSDLNSKRWLNKRLSCFSQQDKDGTWAEYFYAKTNEVLPVSDKLSASQAATFFVNPFTAWGLFEIALQRESTAIIVNAAGGRVADFLFEIAKIHEVEVIAIARKRETAAALFDRGLKNLLVEGDPDFEVKLAEIATKLNATTAFDAVGGSLSGQIFNLMPPDSEVILYGGLSGKAVSGLNPLDFIFQNKLFSGFNLNNWMADNDAVSFEVARETLEKMMVEGRLSTKIQQEIALAEISKGLRNYLSAMSEGKVVIKF